MPRFLPYSISFSIKDPKTQFLKTERRLWIIPGVSDRPQREKSIFQRQCQGPLPIEIWVVGSTNVFSDPSCSISYITDDFQFNFQPIFW